MADSSAPALAVRGVWKAFPGLVALRGVDLEVGRGEVRALVGENGAGKSTLIKIIAGALGQDEGVIEVDGAELTRASPALAARLGIAVIHQDRQIAADISVAENVLLGRLPERFHGVVDWSAAHRQTRGLLDQVGLNVDSRARARQLSIAEHQALEIARALNSKAQLVIMDEPTASLSAPEIRKLFEIIRRLKAAGRTVLYISHHLEEVFSVAETVTVMRDGSIVGTHATTGLTPQDLTGLMFGRDVRQLEAAVRSEDHEAREVVLEARDLESAPYLRGVSLSFHLDEVVCITGGIGSGRRELARCLAGAQRPERGTVRVTGTRGSVRSPRQAVQRGVGFVPDDRKREGLLLPLDLVENVDLSRLSLSGNLVAAPKRRRRRVTQLARELQIRYRTISRPVQELSGGNQQKALLGRLLNIGARVMIFDEPTAGVDVGTKLEIYRVLRRLAGEGVCVIVFSSDFEEIKLLADRAVVLRRGKVVDEIQPSEISEERLLSMKIGRVG